MRVAICLHGQPRDYNNINNINNIIMNNPDVI
jgi:hypothetical protein